MKPQFVATAAALSLSFAAAPQASALTSETVRNAPVNAGYSVLSSSEKRKYRAIYNAIEISDWTEANRLIDNVKSGPMKSMARAELYLAANSPRVEADDLSRLLNEAPWLPQAERLESLAIKRGATGLPQRPVSQQFSYLGESPRRKMPNLIDGGNAASVRDRIRSYIKNDQSFEAEQYLNANSGILSPDALTEMQHRVSWSYYIENDDRNAQRLSAIARGGSGVWAAQAAWSHGMSSWRLGDYANAYESFDLVARRADNDDMRAAGLYWSARAAMASGKPQSVQLRMQNAARLPETFYGILASESLGMEPIAKKQIQSSSINWKKLKRENNVNVAVGLAEIGEVARANDAIKFQARIGDATDHGSLANLAGQLNLPATQLWLGHYGPSRDHSDALARYPMPNWQPLRGWRIDPALAFAVSLQESQFRTAVVSPAGARGLMQIMPGTASYLVRNGVQASAGDLNNPATNLEFGQSYLERLRDNPVTGGLLPKVIAAYNAGPTPVSRWNSEIRDNGDPLLYMESVPFWETRGYLTIILRNYWIYEMRGNRDGGSKKALAQSLWPRFPGSNGISQPERRAPMNSENSFAN